MGFGIVLGTIAAKIGSSLFSDKRRKEASRDQFNYLEGKGLTPWEINSGSAAGLGGGGAGNTLGIGPELQQLRALKFQASENEKERENKRAVADIQTGPAHKTADIAGRMERPKTDQIRENIKILKVRLERDKIELENLFPILVAKMGPDNLMVAMGMILAGVKGDKLLMGSGVRADAKTRKQMEDVASWLMKYKGVSGNLQGIVKTGTDSAKEIGRNILGRINNR